jgi:hypothetical protein
MLSIETGAYYMRALNLGRVDSSCGLLSSGPGTGRPESEWRDNQKCKTFMLTNPIRRDIMGVS